MSYLPEDIQPQWLSVIRRLQSVAKDQNGMAVVSFRVLVDINGTPIAWTAPQKVLIEPKSKASTLLMVLADMKSM